MREVPKLFIYCLSPIDFWDGWGTFAIDFEGAEVEVLDALPRDPFVRGVDPHTRVEHLLLDRAYAARSGFQQCGWEGDAREGFWRYSAVPSPEAADSDFMIAVKQDNNGTTFIASPIQLVFDAWQGAFRGVVADGAWSAAEQKP